MYANLTKKKRFFNLTYF